MISCRKICKSFGGRKIINNFSADFKKGTTLLTGENGTGKSTMLMIISGVELFDSGELIFLDAENKCSISTDSIEEPKIFTLAEIFKLQRRFNEVDDELYRFLIDELNLNQFLCCRISEVSTGTLKKLSVVSALIKRSNFLLLDEPFNGIDQSSKDVLKQVIINDSRSKIIVDHNRVLPFDHLVSL